MILLYLALALQQPADSITLTDALERAQRLRGTVTGAAAGAAAARAAFRIAGTISNPTISYSHSESTPINHLLVDQPLDWLLRRGPERAAARADITRAVADSAGTVTSLRHDVRVAFYRARAARLAETLVRAQATLADSVAGIASARLRAGDISLLEQEQATLEARAGAPDRVGGQGSRDVPPRPILPARIAWEGPPPAAAGALDAGSIGFPSDSVEPAELPAVRAAVADSAAAAARARTASLAPRSTPDAPVRRRMGRRRPAGRPRRDRDRASASRSGITAAAARTEARARAEQAAALAREARLDALRQARQARIHLEETAARARDRPGCPGTRGRERARAGACGPTRPARPASSPCSTRCAASATISARRRCRTSSPSRRRSPTGTR